MAKRFTLERSAAAHKTMVARILCVSCAYLMTMTLMASIARAQPSALNFTDGGTQGSAKLHVVGLPLTPLSLREMSSETAQGIPTSKPTVTPRSQGTGSVLLWDEVGGAKSTSQNTMTGSMTLNIVH